jgi:hypothetical protein
VNGFNVARYEQVGISGKAHQEMLETVFCAGGQTREHADRREDKTGLSHGRALRAKMLLESMDAGTNS